jgi:hypothetical protein
MLADVRLGHLVEEQLACADLPLHPRLDFGLGLHLLDEILIRDSPGSERCNTITTPV